MMGRVGVGSGGPETRRTEAQTGTAIAGAFVLLVLLAVGLTRMIDGRFASELTAPPTYRTASARDDPTSSKCCRTFPESSRTGEITRPAPVTARIIDPDTGEEVLVPLPPGSTVIDGEVVPIGSSGTTGSGGGTATTGSGGTATTGPGTGTTGTTSPGTPNPTTSTSPPTTQDTTTTTEATTTTEISTTTTEISTTTTESTTTTADPVPPPP
jgi:hypothetical protein